MSLPQSQIDALGMDYSPIKAELELFAEQVQTRPDPTVMTRTNGMAMIEDLRGLAAKMQSYANFLNKEADTRERELIYLPDE